MFSNHYIAKKGGCFHYTTFGSVMNQRTYTAPSKDYKYGFNGKEKDNEGMGGGGSTYDYGFRIYNPSLGRFLSVDPLTSTYPHYTPYQFSGNKPIWAVDIDGLEEATTNSGTGTKIGASSDPNSIHVSTVATVVLRPKLTGWQKFETFGSNFLVSAIISATAAVVVTTIAAAAAVLIAPVAGTIILATAAVVGVAMLANAAKGAVTGKDFVGNVYDEEDRWALAGGAVGGVVGGLGSSRFSMRLYRGTKLKIKQNQAAKSAKGKQMEEATTNTETDNGTSQQEGLTSQEKRLKVYQENSPNWAKGSLNTALNKFAKGIEGVKSTDGVKTRYYNSETKIEVIVDNENGYFRIFNHNTNQYLNINGELPSTASLKGKAAQDAVQQQTHINNTD